MHTVQCTRSKNRLKKIFTKNPERKSGTRNRSAAGSCSNLKKTKQVAKILGRKKVAKKKAGQQEKVKVRWGCRVRGAWRPGRRLCQYCCACPTKCSKSALLLLSQLLLLLVLLVLVQLLVALHNSQAKQVKWKSTQACWSTIIRHFNW